MRTHDHSQPGSARRTQFKPQETQAEDSRVPGVEFPVAVYVSVIGAFGWILLASWFAFGSGTEADLSLGIATVLGIVFFALPIIMYEVGAARFRAEHQRLDDFLGAPVETATGALTGAQAWLQILIIPLTLAFAAILIGAVHILVA
jgi:hypothetical protein